MILADKILMLRKKLGYSQEELASQLNVSRQSISKWEQAQSVPEMDKVIKLSELFGVSIDYLLKDDQHDIEYIDVDGSEKLRQVDLETSHNYLDIIETYAPKVGFAISGFIVSPIVLIILKVLVDNNKMDMTDSTSTGVGLLVMFALIAISVGILVNFSVKVKEFEFLDKSMFETEYGVDGFVNQRQKEYKSTHTKNLILGVLLCILSVSPCL